MPMLQLGSAISAGLAGCVIIVFWMIAAHDKKLVDRECGGCIQALHDTLDGRSGTFPDFLEYEDSYSLLFYFGIVLCAAWLVTAGFAFVKPYLNFFIGLLTLIVHSVVFALIYTKLKDGKACIYYQQLTGTTSAWKQIECKESDNWETKHQHDSFDFFWSGGLICFILAAYQLGFMGALLLEQMIANIKQQLKELADRENAANNEPKKPKTEEPSQPQVEPAPEQPAKIEEVQEEKPVEEKVEINEPSQKELKEERKLEEEPEPEVKENPVSVIDVQKLDSPEKPLEEEQNKDDIESEKLPEDQEEKDKDVIEEEPLPPEPDNANEIVIEKAEPAKEEPGLEEVDDDDLDELEMNPPPEDSPMPSMIRKPKAFASPQI